MTHNEIWIKKYQEIAEFIEREHRNPSKHDPEERGKYCNWLKHNRKLINAGEMKPERVAQFQRLTELMERYKRKNQWGALDKKTL